MICKLCKLLYNPLKRMMLIRIYTSHDGVNVGILSDEMHGKGLVPSGVSQYLKEFENLGVIRRSRAGRYVNYYPAPQNASSDIRLAVEEFVKINNKMKESTLDAIFGALMNPFRASVVAALSKARSISALEICEKTEHQPHHLKRDLQAAIDAGLIRANDTETAFAVYHFIPPTSRFTKLLVSLC